MLIGDSPGRPPERRALLLILITCASLLPTLVGCKDDPMPPPGPMPVNRAERLEACIILRACGHGIIDSSATSLICGDPTLGEAFGLRENAEAIIDCIRNAPASGDTCMATGVCLAGGSTPAACGGSPTCDGDVVVQCSGGFETRFDCTASGLFCEVDLSGSPSCGFGSCDPMTFPPSCNGTQLEQCSNGVISDLDCGNSGRTCVDDAGAVFCGGGGAACDESMFPDYCEGDIAHFCDGGAEGALDCALFGEGQTCTDIGGGNVTCAPVAMNCADVADDDCDGDVIELCVNGDLWRYSCLDLGFSTCAVMNNRPDCI